MKTKTTTTKVTKMTVGDLVKYETRWKGVYQYGIVVREGKNSVMVRFCNLKGDPQWVSIEYLELMNASR